MRRFILADPKLRATVEAMILKGDHGIPHDDLRAAVLSHLDQPSESFLDRLLAWLFDRPHGQRRYRLLRRPTATGRFGLAGARGRLDTRRPVDDRLYGCDS